MAPSGRSEEHTSELQSQSNLVCRLLLEKKNCQSARPDDRGASIAHNDIDAGDSLPRAALDLEQQVQLRAGAGERELRAEGYRFSERGALSGAERAPDDHLAACEGDAGQCVPLGETPGDKVGEADGVLNGKEEGDDFGSFRPVFFFFF